MIVVTGAAGFIGSALSGSFLNGKIAVIGVDDFSRETKRRNFENKPFHSLIDRSLFPEWIEANANNITAIFHLGARTDTAEMDVAIFDQLNLNYSKTIWNACVSFNIPLLYASSAATYGGGEYGYNDNHDIVKDLAPLNPYGDSKNDFDIWALTQEDTPPQWYGVKFFNVYGPNEYHKGRMASVIFHCYQQIQQKGKMSLFRSHKNDIENGHQSRDFIYVKDVVNMCRWLLASDATSGLYNIGTGKARTFLDLAKGTFHALGLDPNIDFIDTPIDIRDKYQYFTEANMNKLQKAGYNNPTYTLEEGIKDYIQNYMKQQNVL